MASSSIQMEGSSLSLSGRISLSTEHDVYISFNIADTRKFVDNLRTAFSLVGIRAFYHDSQLEIEETSYILSPQMKASKFIIVLLSKNYADSGWCLDELVEILRLKRAGIHRVIPVFYHIDPIDVRYQNGEFGSAFRKYAAGIKNKKAGTWRAALSEVGKLSEFHLPISPYVGRYFGYVRGTKRVDRKFISRIVRRVHLDISDSEKLEPVQFDIGDSEKLEPDMPQSTPSGRKFRNIWKLTRRERLLNTTSQADRMEIQLDFPESECTLSKIGELPGLLEKALKYKLPTSKLVAVRGLRVMTIRSNDLPEIPDNISFPDLEELFFESTFPLNDIPSSFFERMPALKILDMSNSFLTTTLPHSVLRLIKLEQLVLQCSELLQELPGEIDALGNLKVLDLSGCRSLFELPESIGFPQSLSTLDLTDCVRLRKLPESISKLRSLENLYLSGCQSLFELPESIGFPQSLSTLDLTDCVNLRKLPESISKLRSLENLYLSGCASLLEFHAKNVSINRLSTSNQADKTEVHLDFHGRDGTLTDITELFGLMQKVLEYESLQSKSVAVVKLKVIHVSTSKLSEIPENLCFPHLEKLLIQSDLDLNNIPSSLFERIPALEVLSISNRSIKTLPRSFFKLIGLEELHLRGCELLLELPHEINALGNLKLLDLSGCTNLAEIPDSFNFLQSLTSLNLRDCGSLTKLPESISKLRSLKYLYLSGCTKLVEIPESIEMLGSISSLDLTNCKSLTKLPKSIGKLRALQHLDLSGCTNLTEIPESIEFFKSLTSLVLRDCLSLTKLPESLSKLRSLKYLYLSGCTKLVEIPEFIEMLGSISSLDLTNCKSLTKLPKSIGKLRALQHLDLSGCTNLTEIPESIEFFKSLTSLVLRDCLSLTKLPESLSKLRSLRYLNLHGCSNLAEIPESIEVLEGLYSLNLTNCKSLRKLPEAMSKLSSLKYLYLTGCTSLYEFHAPGVSINKLSTTSHADKMEVHLDFHGAQGTLFDITELLSLMKKFMEYKLRNSRSAAVMNLNVMHIGNFKLSELPDNLSFPNLQKLFLKSTFDLSYVPSSFFERMPALKVLDISNKSITTLPLFVSKLLKLEELNLRGCELLIELPGEIAALGNLKKLVLSGCTSLAEIPDSLDFPRSLSSLDLSDCKSLTELPKGVSKLTSLQKLNLSGCLNLFEVPNSLFEKMPHLQVLDMSNTSIKTLPSWIFQLTELEELILRGCELLMELPGEIGALGNLKVLDLEGTDLVSLPMTLGGLIKLKCLKVSLHDGESYRRNKDIVEIIPKTILLNLTQLEELSINLDPHVTWCDAAVAAIINDLLELRNLKTLKLYLPMIELLQNLLRLVHKNDNLSIYQRLSNFSFIIGPHAQRFISRLPCELEEEILKLKRCLKYINGRDITTIFAEALRHASALYLDRHWTIQKLSVFKFEDLTELKFCLMVDCNEMQTVFDGNDFNLGVANYGDEILSLQYLAIHYLKNLENIWRGPGVGCCVHSLKVLVLHTCPNLTTIFTPVLLGDLVNLKEIIVDDCPKITSLIAEESTQLTATEYLPRLKKLSLFYLPELESISRGISIGPELEKFVIYDCPKLKRFPFLRVRNEDEIKIKGESEWWNALEWKEPEWSGGQPQYLHRAFSEIDGDGNCLSELAPQYGNSLRLFVEECNAN
ncbi:hypothetical protein AgCh_022738 [Apium graveolens]